MSPGLPVRLGRRVRSAEFLKNVFRRKAALYRASVVNRHGAISLLADLQRQRQALLAEGVRCREADKSILQRYRWCINPSVTEGWRRINTG